MSLFSGKSSFAGGVHPPQTEELSAGIAFEIMPVPSKVLIPLSQHLGKPAKPIVMKGADVIAGEVIAEADGFVSSPVMSSISGKVTKITVNATVSGFPKDVIEITASDNPEEKFFKPMDYKIATPSELLARIKEAGIVGQGGAAFPTFIKLSPPPDKKIDYIILNGCECEPYLTRDYRYMVEKTAEVIEGLKISMKAAGVPKGIIGIEDNKPLALKIINDAIGKDDSISCVALKTKYPQGAEKMLIKAATGREVPPGKLPFEIGIIIQNIGTAVEISEAVTKGIIPLFAALTVSGRGIGRTGNFYVRIGTPIADVIEYCGGLKDEALKVIAGGPMMGFGQYDLSAPVVKATSGILALTAEEIKRGKETSCLRCGQCVDVCPMNLLPTKLAKLIQNSRVEEAGEYGLNNCMECGSCSYVCPANLPLVQWIRIGKKQLVKINKEKKSA